MYWLVIEVFKFFFILIILFNIKFLVNLFILIGMKLIVFREDVVIGNKGVR